MVKFVHVYIEGKTVSWNIISPLKWPSLTTAAITWEDPLVFNKTWHMNAAEGQGSWRILIS